MAFFRLLVACFCATLAHANFVIDIPPKTVECFFEEAAAGTGITTSFVVEAGGNLDVDVSITSPDGTLIGHSTEGASDETVRAKAPIAGKYSYVTGHSYTGYWGKDISRAVNEYLGGICFSNEMSSRTWKTVQFSILVGDAPQDAASQTEEKQRQLTQMVSELSHSLTTIKHDQEFMETRMNLHQMVAENTKGKVVTWFAFQAILMIAMCLFQVYYIKQTFEVKMVV